MPQIISFSSICLLLVIGKILRVKIKFFQKLYLPSSLIAGILGLIVIQLTGNNLPSACTLGWSRFPSFLINIVFAALFLGTIIPSLKHIWKISGQQLAYGQLVAWGQYVVGISVTLLLLVPLFKVPSFFGVIIPVGFEGGHGTAAGLKETFEIFNWPEGTDYCLTSATFGILSAVIIGMALINWAARRGLTASLKKPTDLSDTNLKGLYKEDERPVAGYQTVSPDSIDSLALNISIIGIAILIGYFLKQLLMQFGGIFIGFPLFPLCMIGGLIVQLFLTKIVKSHIVDRGLILRISGLSLDFLVVAAVASIKISVVIKFIVPFLIVVIAGILWNVFCVMFLAKRLLKDAWFERAIAEMGQSMGVTATGLLLLRVADSKEETEAYKAFGYKQLLHEPFMGGGLWTSLAIPLAITQGPFVVLGIALTACIIWIVVSLILRKT